MLLKAGHLSGKLICCSANPEASGQAMLGTWGEQVLMGQEGLAR